MTITLFGLKNCDTCKKAIKALEGAGKSVSFVDIRADADLKAKLPGWLDAVGAEALTNTRSTTWRGLDEAQRARAKSDALGLLSENPTLIKRPVIEAGGTVHVGWTMPVQEALL
ncbi:ArsC family transcriptional regulator [Maricaulaceae bacterium EIL42A08]|nr:ArsC family transcriptional regulator [Maricaulaceae bacterium EIL42A08]